MSIFWSHSFDIESSIYLPFRIVNLNIRNYSVLPVVKELARCFDMFPNLHSVRLQISYNPNERSQGYRSEVNRVFCNRSYPQIRSAIVSESVYDFLACCPQIRTAHPTERHLQYKSSFLCALFKCSQLENLEIDIKMADYTGICTSPLSSSAFTEWNDFLFRSSHKVPKTSLASSIFLYVSTGSF